MTDYLQRAMEAYFRAGSTDQPARCSGICSHNGQEYVRLENVNGILAIYAITPTGRVRRLKHWPKELNLV